MAVLCTAVIYDSPVYHVFSIDNENEQDNFDVGRHVPFDRGKYLTGATEKQNTAGTVVLECPELKPTFNKDTQSKHTLVPTQLIVITTCIIVVLLPSLLHAFTLY